MADTVIKMLVNIVKTSKKVFLHTKTAQGVKIARLETYSHLRFNSCGELLVETPKNHQSSDDMLEITSYKSMSYKALSQIFDFFQDKI